MARSAPRTPASSVTPAAPAPPAEPALANAEIVRRVIGALDRGDHDVAARHLHRDAEWHNTRAFPGAAVVTGPAAIIRFWDGFREDFDQEIVEIEHLAEDGDLVVAGLRSIGRGRASGASLETRWAIAARMRDGRIVRLDVYGGFERALEATGLTP